MPLIPASGDLGNFPGHARQVVKLPTEYDDENGPLRSASKYLKRHIQKAGESLRQQGLEEPPKRSGFSSYPTGSDPTSFATFYASLARDGYLPGGRAREMLAYSMEVAEATEHGYRVIELPRSEMLEKFGNPDGWEEPDTDEIYVARELAGTRDGVEVVYHERKAKAAVDDAARNGYKIEHDHTPGREPAEIAYVVATQAAAADARVSKADALLASLFN